ncbi:MAG: CHAT domain-containing tetratricopeptide repeat protein [Gemmataceae bacterium]
MRPLFLLAVLAGLAHAGDPARPTVKDLDAAFLKGMELRRLGKDTEAIPFLEKAAAMAPAVFGAAHANTGSIVNQLGIAYLAVNDNAKALAAFTRAAAIREVAVGTEHPQLAEVLSNAAMAHGRLRQWDKAEALYRRSIAIAEKAKSPGLAVSLMNLAALFSEQGRPAEAEPLLLRALEVRSAIPGKAEADLADTLNSLGAIYFDLARYRDAEAALRRSIKATEDRFGPKHPILEAPLNHLGMVLHSIGRFRDAEAAFLRSLRLRETRLPKDHPDLAAVLNNLASLYTDMERPADAEKLYLRCLAIMETRLGKTHPNVARALANLGLLYGNLGRRKEAESHLRRAIEVQEAALGKDHPVLGIFLNNLSTMLVQDKRYADAEPVLLRALAISETRGEDHPDVAANLNNLGMVYKNLKRPADAEAAYLRSLKIAERRFGPEHFQLTGPLHNLATLYATQGRDAEARAAHERAFAILTKAGRHNSELASVCDGLARVHARLGAWDQALKFQDRCLALAQEGIQTVFAFSSESAMHAFLATTADFLPQMIDIAYAGRLETAPSLALDWTLRRKGAVFDAVRRFRAVQDLLAPDAPLFKRLIECRELKQILADAALKGAPARDAEAFAKEMDTKRERLASLEAELSRGLAERLPGHAAEVGAEAVRKRLLADAALVEFVRLEAVYYAFVLPREGPVRLLRLGDASPIDKGVAALRRGFSDFQEKLKDCDSADEARDLEKSEEKTLKKTAQDLHTLVFEPLRKHLGKVSLVFLAPDGDLTRVPFEALASPDGKYLVETFRFVYLASGRDLLRPDTTQAKGTVIFANPDFQLNPEKRAAGAAKLTGKPPKVDGTRGAFGDTRVGWKPLPGAASEAREIKKLLDAGAFAPVQVFQGPDALEEAFRRLPAPRILHLATHGFSIDYDPKAVGKEGSGAGWARGRLKQFDNPLLRSGFILAGANNVGEQESAGVDDGWVTAEEISLLDLRGTDLVVLSACQTGLGDLKTGEGVSGLRWAFLYAGARTLVTSLFEVPDAETRDLMKAFYARLGEGKLAALHGAQRALIEQRRMRNGAAHPFFWASFVLVGDPG